MFDAYYNIKNRILKAIKLINNQGKPNITKIACNFCTFSLKLKNCWFN